MDHKLLYASSLFLAAICFIPGGITVSQQVRELRDPFAGVGARAMAMADAHIAEPFDVGSFYWNPASLTFIDHSSMLLDYTRSPETRSTGYRLAVPLILSRNQAFGLGFTYDRLNDPSHPNGFFPDEYGLDLASSTALSYSVSIGMRAGMRFGHSDYAQAFMGFLTLGAMYAPSPTISYAFVYNGLSLGSQHSSDESAPMILQQLQRSFEIGVTMRYPAARSDRVVTISVANRKIIGQDGLLYKAGIEINPLDVLSFRMGYVIGPNVAGARYGLGVNTRWLQVNYAVLPGRTFAPTHRASMLIML